MIAAIYARKSTDEQTESIPTQVENGLAFGARRGWTTPPDLVFKDTGSRAEFVKRSDLTRLRVAAARKAFDVVIMRDDSRLGGDMLRTTMIAQELADLGIKIVFYSTGEPLDLSTPTARLVACVRAFGAEDERAKIASRTRESLERRARHGFVAGGAVFGYRNVRGPEGVRREVDEAQAAIVRSIFEMYARGEGLRTIAKQLNARHVEPPRAGRRGTGSWAPSSIREMLRRELYVGRDTWGEVHKTYKGGTKIRTDEHSHELVTIEVPELRIVDPETWTAVQRRTAGRMASGASFGTRRGAAPRHLLTGGLSRCGTCGGPIQVAHRKVSYESVPAYGCAWHRDRGAAVCDNGLRRPVAEVDAAVAAWVREALREDIIVEVLRELRRRLEEGARRTDDELPAIEAEARKLRREVETLADAIATSETKPVALVRRLDERERALRDLDARMRTARAAPGAIDLELRRLEREARERLRQIGDVLARNPAEGRAVLQAFLAGPLRFDAIETADGKRFRVSGKASLGGDLISTASVPSGNRTELIVELPLLFVA